MRRLISTVALLGLAAAGCSKSDATLRQEIKDCSAISLDAPGISTCLVARFKWAPAKATAAGASRQHELDSIAAFQKDSIWRVDEKAHHKAIADCASGGGDLARCLENAHGFDDAHAAAIADSLWQRETPKHRGEIQTCERQRKSSVGSCLILYYKWAPARALALDDSLARAKAKAWKNH